MTAPRRTVLVTGATRGLGHSLVEQLAGHEDVRVLACGRTQSAADAVSPGSTGVELELASLASVHSAARQVAGLAGGRPLHAVVCNAGIQVRRRRYTADGVEATIGVNHIGHVALIEALLRQTGPPARLILVASATHDPAERTGMPDPLETATLAELAHPGPPIELAGRDGRRRYTTAKLANVRTAFALTRRLPGTLVYAADPGLLPGTGLARDAGQVQQLLWGTVALGLLVLPGVQTTAQAAGQLARLVLDPAPPPSGSYVVRGQVSAASTAAQQVPAQDRLYADTVQLISEMTTREG